MKIAASASASQLASGKIPVLSNHRLILKEMERADVASIIEISVYDGVFAKNEADAAHMLEQINADVANGESLHWGIFLKDTNELVGTCGYYRGFAGNCGEIGYLLRTSYRGLGIMTEAVSLIVSFGFEKLKLNTLVAYTSPANSASMAVLQRVGFGKVNSEGSAIKFEMRQP